MCKNYEDGFRLLCVLMLFFVVGCLLVGVRLITGDAAQCPQVGNAVQRQRQGALA